VTQTPASPGWWYPLAFGGMVCAVFGWNAHRAATLGITHDEAVTYQWFVAGGPERIYSAHEYDANNHVLYSLLAWASVRLFGLSELALRLPSVLAGPLLMFATGRLFRLLAGSRALSLIGLTVVALNPLVMDFQVAARGYGLGLALSVWAWYDLGRYLVSGKPRRLLPVGVCQGLAVGANLVYAFPNVALGAAFLILTIGRSGPAWRATLAAVTRWYLLPAVAVVIVLSLPILGHLGGSRFYYGTSSLTEMVLSLVQPSVYALADRGSWGLPPELPADGPGPWTYAIAMGFAATLAPVPVVAWRMFREPARGDEWGLLYVFLAGGAAGLILLLVGCHWFLGTLYPKDRTGLYFVPLAVGCLLLVLRRMLASGGTFRALAAGVSVALVVLGGLFAAQIQAEYLYQWRFDAGTKRVYRLLAERAASEPGVRIGHDWIFEPALNFYRETNGDGSLAPFNRDGPDGDFDYYYLEARTARDWVRAGGLRVIDEDPVSASVVGVPAGRERSR
jgi:hypothetical protein